MPPVGRKLPRLLAEEANTYAGADLVNAVRLAAVIAGLSGLLTVVYFAFDPPTETLGTAGWAVAGTLAAACFVAAGGLLRGKWRLGFNALLGLSYVGLAAVAVLVWLAGRVENPYHNLYLLWVGSAIGVHPPRRGLAFLAVTAVAASLPLAYDGWDSARASYIAAAFLMWAALAILIMLLMTYVRAQRVNLRAKEGEAQRLARADSLTGLGNRRAFDEALTAEVARVRRAESTVSIALLDIDDFKDLNDRYGHLEGDRCLKGIADAIADSIRGGDRAFRWGGDEIALLFPDTPYDGAEESLDRIRIRIQDTVYGPQGRGLTVSWGTAELGPAMAVGDLLAQADLALMNSKHRSTELNR
ncbi:MAG: GGDEF domain-containing protein [Solirubrobacterales bacterium]